MGETIHDVAIIGAGPIGIELAAALKLAKLNVVHLEARQIAHTISWFAPQTRFFSSNERIAIAGVPLQTADQSKASREEYLAYLRSVVQQFDLRINTFEPVVAINSRDGGFSISTRSAARDKTYSARKIILCTGGTDRPRRLNIPGENLPHVSAYFQDPHLFFRRRLLIVGGRNSAVEAAIRCYRAGSHVAMSYYRDAFDEKSIKYWLMPEVADLLSKGKIEKHFGTAPVEITACEVRLRKSDGEIYSVAADAVLLLIGYEADMSLCKMAGVELLGDCQTPNFDVRTMETNVPGMFVAGTAVGGTQQRYRVFIENCHIHVARILAALTGAAPPGPESRGPAEGLEN